MKTAGVYYGHDCLICNGEPETLAYFLLNCPALVKVRRPHLLKLQNIIDELYLQSTTTTEEELVSLILDP